MKWHESILNAFGVWNCFLFFHSIYTHRTHLIYFHVISSTVFNLSIEKIMPWDLCSYLIHYINWLRRKSKPKMWGSIPAKALKIVFSSFILKKYTLGWRMIMHLAWNKRCTHGRRQNVRIHLPCKSGSCLDLYNLSKRPRIECHLAPFHCVYPKFWRAPAQFLHFYLHRETILCCHTVMYSPNHITQNLYYIKPSLRIKPYAN